MQLDRQRRAAGHAQLAATRCRRARGRGRAAARRTSSARPWKTLTRSRSMISSALPGRTAGSASASRRRGSSRSASRSGRTSETAAARRGSSCSRRVANRSRAISALRCRLAWVSSAPFGRAGRAGGVEDHRGVLVGRSRRPRRRVGLRQQRLEALRARPARTRRPPPRRRPRRPRRTRARRTAASPRDRAGRTRPRGVLSSTFIGTTTAPARRIAVVARPGSRGRSGSITPTRSPGCDAARRAAGRPPAPRPRRAAP